MFTKASPESMGISSKDLLDFFKMLDKCRMHTHSVLMAKGDKIICEGYYKPFDKNFIHRMYSVSKSFISVAVGLAVTEGILSLDDTIADYFPEFTDDIDDSLQKECTVRHMLCMKSNIGNGMLWWGRFQSRVEAYYSLTSSKIPGSLFFYDSIGSFLLGCIIEKLTGKTFLDYLKEGVLNHIGFSSESYTLTEPGGYTVGDSGVMCTTRDLALFARFIMQKGEWNGIQYIDRDYMENAVSLQAHNDSDGSYLHYGNQGYGYLIWLSHESGFSLTGLGDQLAICDTEKDLLFVMTGDNQANIGARHVIYHEYVNHFLPKVSSEPLEPNPDAQKELDDYLSNRTLVCQSGKSSSLISDEVNGVTYCADDNPLNITSFCANFLENSGTLSIEMDGKTHNIEFDFMKNNLCKFSFGEVPVPHMMGKNIEGSYNCAISGGWITEDTLAVKIQVIDTYFGCLKIHIAFDKTNRATMSFHRSGQYVFENMSGFVTGKNPNTNP